jgi:mRNA-degrading endonuclease RelE of RelBE toxin-antitoxin system
MMSSDRYTVRVEEPAASVLRGFTPDVQAAFVVVLSELETDPNVVVGGINWRDSRAFVALRRRGYPILRLKAKETQQWRVFYYVDKERKVVLVKEVVPREADEVTYGSGAHVQRLVENYNRFKLGGGVK